MEKIRTFHSQNRHRLPKVTNQPTHTHTHRGHVCVMSEKGAIRDTHFEWVRLHNGGLFPAHLQTYTGPPKHAGSHMIITIKIAMWLLMWEFWGGGGNSAEYFLKSTCGYLKKTWNCSCVEPWQQARGLWTGSLGPNVALNYLISQKNGKKERVHIWTTGNREAYTCSSICNDLIWLVLHKEGFFLILTAWETVFLF